MKIMCARFDHGESEEQAVARTARAVILYDHLETLLTANRLLDHVVWNGSPHTDWQVNSWRFDMLTWGCRLEAYRALEESVDVHLVVVAIRDLAARAELPTEWLVRWADSRRRPSSCLWVMTFGNAKAGVAKSPAIGALRLLAESRALPFSILCGPTPDEVFLTAGQSGSKGRPGRAAGQPSVANRNGPFRK